MVRIFLQVFRYSGIMTIKKSRTKCKHGEKLSEIMKHYSGKKCSFLYNFVLFHLKWWILVKKVPAFVSALCLKSSILLLIIRFQQSYYQNECGHDVSKPNRETIQNSNFMKLQLKVWIRSSRVKLKLISRHFKSSFKIKP